MLEKGTVALKRKLAYKALRIQVGVIAGFHYESNLSRRALGALQKVAQKQKEDRELIRWQELKHAHILKMLVLEAF